MKTRYKLMLSMLPATATALLIIAGCSQPPRESAVAPQNSQVEATDAKSKGLSNGSSPDADSEHPHEIGSHGGIMVSLGRDSYHVEAVVDSEGSVRLYTLGQDESRVIDVESQTLNGFVKADGDADSQSISFAPSPQEGDAENKTSLFVGKLPSELVGRKLDVTIPNIRIAGERFRLGFQSGQESHGAESEMPDKVSNSKEKELYLTPGGRYTAADIVANGNVTASQKFKGLKSAHDMNPKAGDRTCPISGTKANPNFPWIIDGKKYEFCCPPCVDEYLKMAKESADPLPDPESFIKK